MERKKYPIRAEDYELYELVGQGVSAAVYRALCIPLDEVVAIKIIEFERDNSDLSSISREAQTMLLIDHPNVLKAHCSFVNGHDLWIVMPYMEGGSCLHIMKSAYPDGFKEVVIATFLREVLKGLEYLHHHGHIHRDVKAGNILVDAQGGVKLGDFGVSACLFDSGDRQRTRNTIVGTPCWMAPEVMEQLRGYDFKADIWSFGITALELAHGHAPFSKYPPIKVFVMTLQNAPPGLDYERDRKFSRSFKQMIAMCLVKDPSRRPSAQKLLKQPFFKQARSQDYIVWKILEGLPTLGVQHQALKDKEEDLVAQKKMPDGKKEEISQNEYKRGISNWNFDIEDLKAQASLMPDNEDGILGNSLFELDSLQEKMPEGTHLAPSCSLNYDDDMESDGMAHNKSGLLSSPDQTACLQRARSNESESEFRDAGTSDQNLLQNGLPFHGNGVENCTGESYEPDINVKCVENVPVQTCHERKSSASSCSSDILPSTKGESLKQKSLLQNLGNCSGGVSHIFNETPVEAMPKAPKSSVPSADNLDDKSKPPLVQQRGRFKVTSENVDLNKALPSIGLQKSRSFQAISQLSMTSVPSSVDATSNLSACSIFPQLHCILQANIFERDNILSMIKQLSASDSPVSNASTNRSIAGASLSSPHIVSEKSLLDFAHEREKKLIQDITDLQWRLICTLEELRRLKARNA
ncbi:serine/threonine-protein kinase BLUS1-like [Phoenix dactylifera]|uniref:Serine/threonine-protein kinase BLUS1-like n=2 Tax=Phoenix dactylifera TaxID=42345 RepID=A0A8B8ZJ15_PHODC|nr:serine/threonine-protein kinase BLUS1-like [Phoenix dactylifera]